MKAGSPEFQGVLSWVPVDESQIIPLNIVVDGIVALLNRLLLGLFELIGDLFATGLKELLFFPSPYDLTGPNQAFAYNLKFALVLLPVIVVIGAVSMPFANRKKAATWRQLWRIIEVVVFLALARPALHVVLVLVNTTGEYVFPSSYNLSFAGEGILNSLGAIGVTGIALVIGGYILSGISVLGILLLFFILFLREFIFNLVYQGFPILIVAWYLDWGPFKISNGLARTVFRVAGYLVLVGPLIALALQVGAVFGGGVWPPAGQPPADPETTVDFWRQFAGWFMGIALACVFGVKAATLGGVPMAQFGASTGGRTSKKIDSKQDSLPVNGESHQSSLQNQARDTLREIEHRAPYSGTLSHRVSNAKDSMKEKWNVVSDRNESVKFAARHLRATGKSLGPKANRAAVDTYSGGKYALSHLNESPVDWARASGERFRRNPLVSNERRAQWLVNQQPSKSMQQQNLGEAMGWPEGKTQAVVDSLKGDGTIEVYKTSRGTILMSPAVSGRTPSSASRRGTDRIPREK